MRHVATRKSSSDVGRVLLVEEMALLFFFEMIVGIHDIHPAAGESDVDYVLEEPWQSKGRDGYVVGMIITTIP